MRHEERLVRRVNPLDDPDWDEKIETFPAASFFHGFAWAKVLHSTYGFSPYYFVTGGSEHFDSLLPVMGVNSWLTGKRGISLPFTDECEAVWIDSDLVEPMPSTVGQRAGARSGDAPANRLPAAAPLGGLNDEAVLGRMHGEGLVYHIFQSALSFARRSGWKYLELRGGISRLGDIPTSESYLGHTLHLLTDENALLAGFDSSVRRAVRKAETSGLAVEISRDLESVRTFYRLLCLTRKRHGLPPQPFEFFTNIHRHVLSRNQGCVVIAKSGDVPAAAAVFFHCGKKALYKFGASNPVFQHLRGNNLVMWHGIKHCAQQGFESLDFGRTSVGNEGLRRFKLGWGTQERQVDYARYDCRLERFVTASDRAAGWYNRIFRNLPPMLSRAIGAVLYRHIA